MGIVRFSHALIGTPEVINEYGMIDRDLPPDAVNKTGKIRTKITDAPHETDSHGAVTVVNRAPYCPGILSINADNGWSSGTEMATVNFVKAGDPDGQTCTYTVYMSINTAPMEPVDFVDGKVNIPAPDDLNSENEFALYIRSDDGAGGFRTTSIWSGKVSHDGSSWILEVLSGTEECVDFGI